MYEQVMVCRNCGKKMELGMKYTCPNCGGILEIEYDYEAMKEDPLVLDDKEHTGMWKYSHMLPVRQKNNIVTLGEGATPLLRCCRLEKEYGMSAGLYVKAESLNPSGSFKDRPSSVGVSIAKEYGATRVVIASSGNASAAAAAYCARTGIECIVFVPESTDASKVTQAAAYGATVIPVAGNYSNSYRMALECSVKYGWPNITSTFLNPYTVEADKTAAYEVWEQLGGCMPDYVMVPIASGPLLVGMYKGFKELIRLGIASAESRLPAMIGVQSEQCMPITRAYLQHASKVCGWEFPINTIAGGISDPLIGYEQDGDLTLKTALESGGLMSSLSEEEIEAALHQIETKAGLYCEPTSAVAVGAAAKLYKEGVIVPEAKVVCMLTGHGFKYSGRKPFIQKAVSSMDELFALI